MSHVLRRKFRSFKVNEEENVTRNGPRKQEQYHSRTSLADQKQSNHRLGSRNSHSKRNPYSLTQQVQNTWTKIPPAISPHHGAGQLQACRSDLCSTEKCSHPLMSIRRRPPPYQETHHLYGIGIGNWETRTKASPEIRQICQSLQWTWRRRAPS